MTDVVHHISAVEKVEPVEGEPGRAVVEQAAVELEQSELGQTESDIQASDWQDTSDQTVGSLASYPAPLDPRQR